MTSKRLVPYSPEWWAAKDAAQEAMLALGAARSACLPPDPGWGAFAGPPRTRIRARRAIARARVLRARSEAYAGPIPEQDQTPDMLMQILHMLPA